MSSHTAKKSQVEVGTIQTPAGEVIVTASAKGKGEGQQKAINAAVQQVRSVIQNLSQHAAMAQGHKLTGEGKGTKRGRGGARKTRKSSTRRMRKRMTRRRK